MDKPCRDLMTQAEAIGNASRICLTVSKRRRCLAGEESDVAKKLSHEGIALGADECYLALRAEAARLLDLIAKKVKGKS